MSVPNPKNTYMSRVYEQLIEDLQYPVAKNGDVLDTYAIRPGIAWHLVRCGWRKPNNTDGIGLREEFDDPIIKKRSVYGTGIFEDAVTWVGIDEADDPLDDLQNMTMAQIESLPEDLKLEAKRRLGLIARESEPDESAGWHVKPFIQIFEEPDPEGNWG